MKTPTVAEYLVARLAELGINDFFGVPGDFNFNICTAVEASEKTRWVGCCNELNAAYAADGYARVKGFGAVVTTFGVGELSAINAVAGSFAEYVPVFHIGGSPAMSVQNARRVIHHTLGNGDFGVFERMYSEVTAAHAMLSADNATAEIERLIGVAISERRPVYINLPVDVCTQPIAGYVPRFAPLPVDPMELHAAVTDVKARFEKAKRPVVVADAKVIRFGLQDQLRAFVEKANLPVATLAMGKGAIDEQHPNFVGTFMGRLINPDTSHVLETADLIIALGTILGDTNTAAYSVALDRSKTIEIQHDHTRVLRARYDDIPMADMLAALTDALEPAPRPIPSVTAALGPAAGDAGDKLTAHHYYPRMQAFVQPGDILVAETGTTMEGSVGLRLPSGAEYLSQSLWMSIGWATPAAFGAAMAAPDRRVILMTGDVSHQLTAQEVGSMGRFGCKPVILLNNNDGYTIERYVADDTMDPFNDIAQWDYHKLPAAFGIGDAFAVKAETVSDLDAALTKARATDALCYIEVVMDKMDAPAFMRLLREHRNQLYNVSKEESGKLGRSSTPAYVAACPG